jgi:hypothetical protein
LVLLDEGGKTIELLRPEALVAGEPQHGSLHGLRLETAAHRAPALAALDQVGARKHIEVLHHGRQGDSKRRGDLGDRKLGLGSEAIHDRAPRGIGERREGKIELCV